MVTSSRLAPVKGHAEVPKPSHHTRTGDVAALYITVKGNAMKFHRKDSYGEERYYPEPHDQDWWTELTGTKTASKRQMTAYAALTGYVM